MLKGPHTPPLSKWTLGFIITMLLYFHNYRHVADHLMIHLTLPNGCTQRSAKWVEVNKCTTRVCSSPILPVWRVSFAKPSHPWLLGHPWVTHYTLPRGTSLLFWVGEGGGKGDVTAVAHFCWATKTFNVFITNWQRGKQSSQQHVPHNWKWIWVSYKWHHF